MKLVVSFHPKQTIIIGERAFISLCTRTVKSDADLKKIEETRCLKIK